jgi:hypothetical protein
LPYEKLPRFSALLIILFSAFRHGKGKWTNTNGDYYDGDFVYEKRHGYGIYTWPNGDAYEGGFADFLHYHSADTHFFF